MRDTPLPCAWAISNAALANLAGIRECGSRRGTTQPVCKSCAQALFKRGSVDRHGVFRRPARFVSAASQAPQSPHQIFRLFRAGCRVLGRRFPLGRALGRCVPASDPGLVPLHAHEFGSKDPLGGILIVRTAPKSQALDCGRATTREWLRVIEFEEATALAPIPTLSRERAPTSIALPHSAPDVDRDIARRVAAGSDRPRR